MGFLDKAKQQATQLAQKAQEGVKTGQAKLEMLVAQGRLAIAGLALLAVTMSLVVFLVFDVILSLRWAGGVAAALLLAFLWVWYGLPISRRSRDPDAN